MSYLNNKQITEIVEAERERVKNWLLVQLIAAAVGGMIVGVIILEVIRG